jgi:hypothetical protein
MYESEMVLALFVFFILFVPSLLYVFFRKLANPVPLWAPLILAVLVLLAMVGLTGSKIFPEPSSIAGTLVMFTLMLLLVSLAVITPYFWIGSRTGIERPWLVFSLLSFIGVFLMFMSTMGEAREGGPLPQFLLLLPLTGWIIDTLTAILHLGDIVYSPALPVHTVLLAAGLWLEVFIIAAMFYALLGGLSTEKSK